MRKKSNVYEGISQRIEQIMQIVKAVPDRF